jgi:hypothetical protein
MRIILLSKDTGLNAEAPVAGGEPRRRHHPGHAGADSPKPLVSTSCKRQAIRRAYSWLSKGPDSKHLRRKPRSPKRSDGEISNPLNRTHPIG